MKSKDFSAAYLNQVSTRATDFSMNQAITSMMKQCEEDAKAGRFASTFTDRKLLTLFGMRKYLADRGFEVNEIDGQLDEYSFTLSWVKL